MGWLGWMGWSGSKFVNVTPDRDYGDEIKPDQPRLEIFFGFPTDLSPLHKHYNVEKLLSLGINSPVRDLPALAQL